MLILRTMMLISLSLHLLMMNLTDEWLQNVYKDCEATVDLKSDGMKNSGKN